MGFDFSGFENSVRAVPLTVWALIVLFAVCFLLVVFFQVLGLLFGFLLLVGFIVFLVLYKQNASRPDLREFLIQENHVAERRFLKHEIDEQAFKSIVSENEKRLIGIDAGLKRRELPQERQEDVSQVSMKRRHKLKVLLDEKGKVSSELSLARQKYFKHKIDEATFREISMDKQKALVDLEIKISSLYKEEAKDIVKDTAKRLQALKEKTEEELAAEELAEQVETKRQRKKRLKKQ